MSDPLPRKQSRQADREMIQAIRAGNPDAYRGLVEKYQNRVYPMVYGMVRNREDASDITQDAFVKAYHSLPKFRLESSFYTWLYRIAMNLAIDFLRKSKRRGEGLFDDEVATKSEDGTIAERHTHEGPAKSLERKQLMGAIMAALEQLPTDQKQVILLRELEGLSYQEIAEIVGIPQGTVMSRLFYARKKLQSLLADQR